MKKTSSNNFKRLMLQFAILLVLAFSSTVMAQEKVSVKGTILDTDGLAIPGVSVVWKGTTIGTISDVDGNFYIEIPKGQTLVFSFIGMESQSVVVEHLTNLNIVLKSEFQTLDDVVVVGYGTQQKESVVGAIGQISNKKLESVPVMNISHALVGQTAGITSMQSTGELGNESSTIRIRGVGTYASGSQEPLFVIDGLIRDAEAFNALDVFDVKGINILKDASATAVYGVRGANGVIVVTTNRGRGEVMPPKVTATANFGVGVPTSIPDLVDSYGWASLMNEAIVNDGEILENHKDYSTPDELWKFQHNRDYTPAEVEAMNNLTAEQKLQLLNSPAIYYSNTDYLKEMFESQYAPQQKYNVNVRGGTKDVSYYSSVGYSNQGTFLNDFGFDTPSTNIHYEKLNFRTNLDFTSIKNTTIKTSMSAYIHVGDQLGGVDEPTWSRYKALLHPFYTMAPFYGSGIRDGKLVDGTENVPNDLLRKMDGYRTTPITNAIDKNSSQQTRTNIDISIKGEHRLDYLLKGLQVNGTLSFDQNFRKTIDRNDNIPVYKIARNPENPNEILWFGGENNPETIQEKSKNNGWAKSRRFYVDGGVSYSNKFGKHNITSMALLTAERYTTQGLLYNIPKGIYGLVGRATYDYDGKYQFEFNVGYNGSENFSEGNRFGIFPSLSGGWVISNEDFFAENSVVTWLKLRGSYGQVGNSNIGGSRFLYLPGQWAGGDTGTAGKGSKEYSFGNSDGISGANTVIDGLVEASVGNPNVTWETKTSYNIGLDAHMFSDRFSVTMDYFIDKRKDILTRIATTPILIGLDISSLPLYNVGKVTNKGYEFEASWNDEIGQDFNYNISGTFSYSKSNIDYQAEVMKQYGWMNSTGFAVGQLKGFKSDGLFNTASELANRPFYSFYNNEVQLGDIRYVDIDGDGIINDNDKVPIGYSNMPLMNYGFSLSANYKGWGVNLQFVGSAKGTYMMDGPLKLPFWDYNPTTPMQYMTERWTQERYDNGEKISFPRLTTDPTANSNAEISDYWIRSTDFIKLKNVELSYDFGKVRIGKISLKGLRLYANANNVHTWMLGDLMKDIDPEQANSGDGSVSKGWIYPLSRVYNFGLSVKF